MILKELYENVTHVQDTSQDAFMSHVDTTVRALMARYGEKYVLLPGTVWVKNVNIGADMPVYEEYFPAIRDNVLYLLTGNGDRKTDYVAEAEDAYKAVWASLTRGNKFRSADYGGRGPVAIERVIEKPVVHVDHEVEPFDASVETLPAGSMAQVEYDNHHFTFRIPQGYTGPAGAQGERGVTGPQGPQGMQGPQGIQGPRGAKGDKGDRGSVGPTGAQGPQGPKGDKGDQGERGYTGPKGDKGATGATGQTGPQGPKGDTGATGATGPQGPKGDPGEVTEAELAEVVSDVSELKTQFVSPGFQPIDATWSGFTKETGKSADSSGLSNSANIDTYWFTAEDDFDIFITDYNTTYTCIALYNGAIGSDTYITRYRTTGSPNPLPTTEEAAIAIRAGYSVAISINNHTVGTFALHTNSRAINGVVLSDKVSLAQKQITQVIGALPSEKKCKIKYETGTFPENSTERLCIYIPSFDGYILYTYVHTINASKNADIWRLGHAYLVDDDLQNAKQITSTGEWESAVHLKGGRDFSSGNAHGNEVMIAQEMWIDGVYTAITAISAVTDFNDLRIVRTSNLYNPGTTETPGDGTEIIAKHGVEYLISKNGMDISQSIKWENNYTITGCYMGMFPIRENNGSTDDNISKYYYSNRDFDYTEIAHPINKYLPYSTKLVVTSNDQKLMFVFDSLEITTKDVRRMLISDNGGTFNYNKLYDVVNRIDVDANVTANEYWRSRHIYNIVCGK